MPELIIINENGRFGNSSSAPESPAGHLPDGWAFLGAAARGLGFVAVGVCAAGAVDPAARAVYRSWLERGFAAGMGYLERHQPQRFDPRHPRVVEEAAAIVSVALPYGEGARQDGLWRHVAAHARARDYHAVLRDRLSRLGARISERFPGCRWRTFVDAAPILERTWAIAAGLGAQGRHGGLIVPGVGARVVLGEIVCAGLPRPSSAAPAPSDPCGECVRCVEACPTGAIVQRALVDARRCLSYHTIEQRRAELEEWVGPRLRLVFGCDECTACCPHERRAIPCALDPPPCPGPRALDVHAIAGLADAELTPLLQGTCLERGGAAPLRRNARAIIAARAGANRG